MIEFGIVSLVWLIGCGFFIVGTVLWVWMLIDCLTKEPSQGNDKVVWALVILLLHGMGALLYLFIRRPERIRLYGQ